MAAYPPPTQDVPIFNAQLYKDAQDVSLTIAKGDQRYVRYPTAQGAITLQTTTVAGDLLCNSSATFSEQPRQAIGTGNAWDSTNGVLGLAKNAQPIINPLVTGAKALNCNTFGYGFSGTFNYPENGIVYDSKRQQFAVIAFSGGSAFNQLKVSTNGGLTWVDRSYAAATTQPDWCIFYFESIDTYLFTLVSATVTNTRVMLSTDGCQTFTVSNTPSNNLSYRGAAYSPELNVMVMCCSMGNQLTTNGMCYSLDRGLTWNDAVVPAVSGRLQVRWVPELKRFFTTHTLGFFLYSDDGINWISTTVSQQAAPIPQASALCWSPQLGMMISRPSNNNLNVNQVSYSTDGLIWQYSNNTAFFPASMSDAIWVPQLGLFVCIFSSGTGNRMAYSADGLTWYPQSTPSDLFYRSLAYSPQLGVIMSIASQATDPRGMVTSLDNRMPSSWTVFDSSYNNIDASGNWMFKANNLYTDSAQTIHCKNGIELDGTTGSDRQVFTSYVTYRNQNDNATAGQIYASGGDMVYDSTVNAYSHVFAATNSSGVKSNVFAINASTITSSEPISCLDNIVLNGSTGVDRQFYTSYVNYRNQNDNANCTQHYASLGDMFYDNNVNSGSHIMAANDASGNKINIITANASRITTREPTFQQLSNSTSVFNDTNGFLGLAKDAAVAINPTSASAIAAVSTWQLRSTPLADSSFRSISWSHQLGLFAAVSWNGAAGTRVITSPDAITWTYRTTPDLSWQSICWADALGLFVAVGNSGTGNRVMTSSNGVTWTSATSAADLSWTSVAYSTELNLLVAVSSTGSSNIMTSTNGTTWTLRTPPSSVQLNSVIWCPNLALFVAVGNGAVAFISRDGITWVPVVVPNRAWASLAYSNITNTIVATATLGVNRFMYSTDGFAWALATNPVSDFEWNSCCYSPSLQLFLAAATSSGMPNQFATSPDGLTWTLRNASSTGIQVWSVCWCPELGIFVGCGFAGASGQRIITSSFQHRVPTQLNVFASPSNTISQAGDWSIVGTSFQSSNAVTLGSTAGNTIIQAGATLRFNSSTAASAGGGAGQYLNINVNGTNYKIALLNV